MARRKAPRIPDALLDQLLAGADSKTAFEADGLLDALKKALAERALNAEMDHHLAGEDAGNSRNGYGRKTVTTETGRIELAIPTVREKARAELAQNRVVEAEVGQFQAQQILPVDPRADRVGGMPVGQPLHELQERREREPDGRLSGPPRAGNRSAKSQSSTIMCRSSYRRMTELPFGKTARGTWAVWTGTTYVRFAARDVTHLRLTWERAQLLRCDARPPSHRRARAEFATNIKVRKNQENSRESCKRTPDISVRSSDRSTF